MKSISETIEIQNAIIKGQADIIQDLLLLLMQHEAVEKVDDLPCIAKINQMASMRSQIMEE